MSGTGKNRSPNITANVYFAECGDKETEKLMREFLSKLGLEIITKEKAAISLTKGLAPYNQKVIDTAFEYAQAIIVLFTGDEQVHLRHGLIKESSSNSGASFSRQPRLDQIFEAGYALGLSPERTILLQAEGVHLFSDIDGRYVANFTSAEKEHQNLIQQLKSAGCTLHITQDVIRSLRLPNEVASTDGIELHSSASQEITMDERGGSKETETIDPKRVFVIQGRNTAANRFVYAFIKSIGLSPISWEEAAIRSAVSRAPYTGETLDTHFRHAQAVLVLLTGDDEVLVKGKGLPGHEELLLQPRPNVLFETGRALSSARLANRTLFLELGKVRVVENLSGYHRFQHRKNDLMHCWRLIDSLKSAGCPVNILDEDVTRKLWIDISQTY